MAELYQVWVRGLRIEFSNSICLLVFCDFHGSSCLMLFQTIVDSSLYTEVKLFIADLTHTSTIFQIIEGDSLAVYSPSVRMYYANFVTNELDWVNFKRQNRVNQLLSHDSIRMPFCNGR